MPTGVGAAAMRRPLRLPPKPGSALQPSADRGAAAETDRGIEGIRGVALDHELIGLTVGIPRREDGDVPPVSRQIFAQSRMRRAATAVLGG